MWGNKTIRIDIYMIVIVMDSLKSSWGLKKVNENIHLIPSLPPGCLEVWLFQLAGSPPGGRPRDRRRNYISHLPWKHLGLPEEEEREVEVQNIQ